MPQYWWKEHWYDGRQGIGADIRSGVGLVDAREAFYDQLKSWICIYSLPDYAPPAFSSSPDAEAVARSGVLALTRCDRPLSPFIMSYESEQIRLGSLLQEVLDEDGLSMSSGSEAGSDSESADPLPDELHNSESEEELSDRESSGNNNTSYLGKDNSTKWSKEPPRQSVRTRRFNLVTQLPGPKRVTPSEKELLGIWRHFFDDTIIEIIVKYINQSIANVKDNFSRETYAKQTDYNEICCLIAYVTVDEKLEAFRGRCSFRQYIPNKPNPYGIKVQALCDAKMFYAFNMEIYPGKQPNEGPYNLDNSGLAVVQRLYEPIFNTARNVATDNWYSSIPLAEALLQKGLTTVGTIRKDKKEIPSDFNQLRGRSVKSNMFGFRNDMVLVSHVPKAKKNVLLISTMHNDAKVDVETQKPDIILSYNETKGGVDVVDRLCANYNFARATKRWPMVIFYAMLNVSTINSQTANNQNSKLKRRHFIENLAIKLIEPRMREWQMQLNLPRSIRLRLTEILNIDEVPGTDVDVCLHCGRYPCPYRSPSGSASAKICLWRSGPPVRYGLSAVHFAPTTTAKR
ncbi:PiggyBac transposable element-derived protein 4 [Eumeta japonica]|uniref:PiggyBac transposable element-derived protein 4 n=1 Tax=Eumeta variegata TaxID=151549 RepID=A0A4C1TU86_EUMVA|nr:PiggyBac transposable element-derived protein 4 [Eumeta japonica]